MQQVQQWTKFFWCWRVIYDRSWYNLMSAPWKRIRPLILARLRISSLRWKFTIQQTTSLGGSVSLPLCLVAWCRCIMLIGISGALSRRTLNMVRLACVNCLGSTASGRPLTRMLWWWPLLSRSSTWCCSSCKCKVCASVIWCTLWMAASWWVVVSSTSSSHVATAWMYRRRSEMATVILFFMSNATACRSPRLRGFPEGWMDKAGCVLVERERLLLEDRALLPAAWDEAVVSQGWVWNIFGMLRLSCVPKSQGEWEWVAEVLLFGLPMICWLLIC